MNLNPCGCENNPLPRHYTCKTIEYIDGVKQPPTFSYGVKCIECGKGTDMMNTRMVAEAQWNIDNPTELPFKCLFDNTTHTCSKMRGFNQCIHTGECQFKREVSK